jgi:hypothetical protein
MHNHRAMAPSTLRQQRVAEWIDRHIGTRTLTQMAADITDATGWPIDHSRLGRYRNQKLQVGAEVVRHFDDYAAARDLPPVDLGDREVEPSFEERALIAANRQADAIQALVDELRAWRTEDRARIGGLENLTQSLVAQLQPAPAGEARTAPRAPRQ